MNKIKVLFIGNSQFSGGDLTRTIQTISESAPAESPRIEPTNALIGGKGLRGYWEAGDGPGTPRALITAGGWDNVVIQEIFCAGEAEFEDYAARFDEAIRTSGARTILFATANTTEFYSPGYKYPDSFVKLNGMQVAFGKKRGIAVAAAGYAWMAYLGANPTVEQRLDLYAPDKGHPGVKGSWIYAYLLYAVITGRNPELLPLPAGGVDAGQGVMIAKDELVRMRTAAWKQVAPGASSGTHRKKAISRQHSPQTS